MNKKAWIVFVLMFSAGYGHAVVIDWTKLLPIVNPETQRRDYVNNMASTSVGDLVDVSTGQAAAGDCLKFFQWASSTTWEPGACGGGGGGASLAVGTGSIQASNIISSPTASMNFSSGAFLVKLLGNSTAFVFLDFSSITAQGNSISLSDLQTTLGQRTVTAVDEGGASAQTVTQFNFVGAGVSYAQVAGSGTVTISAGGGLPASSGTINDAFASTITFQQAGSSIPQTMPAEFGIWITSKPDATVSSVTLTNLPPCNGTWHFVLQSTGVAAVTSGMFATINGSTMGYAVTISSSANALHVVLSSASSNSAGGLLPGLPVMISRITPQSPIRVDMYIENTNQKPKIGTYLFSSIPVFYRTVATGATPFTTFTGARMEGNFGYYGETAAPVTSIGFQLGYDSLGSFRFPTTLKASCGQW